MKEGFVLQYTHSDGTWHDSNYQPGDEAACWKKAYKWMRDGYVRPWQQLRVIYRSVQTQAVYSERVV